MVKKTPHPWSSFLEARGDAIFWLYEMGYDDLQIAVTLSMDKEQVYLIRTNRLNREKCETSPNKNLP